MVVADAEQAVFAPAVCARTRVVVRKRVPRLTPGCSALTPAEPDSGRAAFPVAEDLEESVTRFGLDRLRWESSQSSNRLAHLLQVGATPGALRQMRFESHARTICQSILEIVRDELHELLARQIVCVGHGGVIRSYFTPRPPRRESPLAR